MKKQIERTNHPENFVKRLREIISELDTERKRLERERTYNKDFLETVNGSMVELDVLACVYEELIESRDNPHKPK
jgi:hypothetical protein